MTDGMRQGERSRSMTMPTQSNSAAPRKSPHGSKPPAHWRRWAISALKIVAVVAVATAVRMALTSTIQQRVPFVTLFPAIVYGAWEMGWRGGVLATVLSALAGSLLILNWDNAVGAELFADQFSLLMFLISGAAISALGQAQVGAREQGLRREQELLARADREALLNEIGQAIRASIDPDEIQQAAVHSLGKALQVDRCYFSTYDLDADTSWIGLDFVQGDTPSVAGQYRISQFQVDPTDFYPGGKTLVIDDTEAQTFPEALTGALKRLRVRAAIAVPFFDEEQLVATLNVAMADTPRAWTPEEIGMVQAVAAQTRTAVESARNAAEQQALIHREALRSRIGLAIRSSLDPSVIQQTAAAVLGDALGADRCYFATYDFTRDRITVGSDWRRPDLAPMGGQYSLSSYQPVLEDLFGARLTCVIEDIQTRGFLAKTLDTLERGGLRSLIATPFYDEGRLAAALIVSMHDGPRAWTPEEAGLVESVAEMTRTALATALNAQREHAIATQLQDALQPSLPETAPGLALAQHYKPALSESAIGGDFYDVFALEPGCTALVVADLSGKGLAAAAQVATVRNMLRYALYNDGSLARTLTTLNRTLAEHNLLTGFATLFAGSYDEADRVLKYVNCGQESALIWRAATGEIEELPPTGPVMGMDADGKFSEQSIALPPGDALIIFTDGLTEAGPRRLQLLGVAGVRAILHEAMQAMLSPCPHDKATAIVTRLIAGVDAFAESGARDDVCLLVAIAV